MVFCGKHSRIAFCVDLVQLADPRVGHRRKFTNKKHKTWDGDGFLRVVDGNAYLQDVSGKEMGSAGFNLPLLPGSMLSIGGKEVEVDTVLSKENYHASRPSNLKAEKVDEAPKFKKPALPIPHAKPLEDTRLKTPNTPKAAPIRPATSVSMKTQHAFKNPLREPIVPSKSLHEPTPRHDPHGANAIVLTRPKRCPEGKQLVDVVVDPLLTRNLRDHQREGVKFLYDCVMGFRGEEIRGAILADEMGLGKSLQTIALIWTLLKQNPIAEEAPLIKKALIVCPVTLINNWRKEFRKWLGNDRLGVYVFDDTKKRITDFTKGKAYNVMIIGYEKLRTVHEELKKGQGIDLVVADEGHRLKTAKNKSALAIKNLDTTMKIILSGTPIQNDLSELYIMVDFVNPDLLGSYKSFVKDFETPILRSRQPDASSKDIEKGEARSEELVSLTSRFILRRNAEILSKYLPTKTEYVLLCRPTASQANIYRRVLACPAFSSALGNPEAALQLITILKKVCNSPYLLRAKAVADESTANKTPIETLLEGIPQNLLRNNSSSTKLRALDQILHTLRTTTSEKIVLVSNYTSTLDLLEALVTSLSHPYVRLDGSTPSSKRQDIVDTFNRSPASQCFAFLLSAKSGGVGLNLIGASRLVLFDVDWNPATDLQAMARIHRDGQKRPCVIYRLLMAGGMDEKIWQRQVTKLGLASNIMDQKTGVSKFSREELKDLFRLDEGRSCQTHDLSGCRCGGRGLPEEPITDRQTTVDSESDVQGGESDEVTVVADEDEEEELPTLAQLTPANKVDMAAQERRIAEANSKAQTKGQSKAKEKRKGNSRMDLLMEYTHIDTSNSSALGSGTSNENEGGDEEDEGDGEDSMQALIHDRVLLDVLRDEGNRIAFAFAKTSTSSKTSSV